MRSSTSLSAKGGPAARESHDTQCQDKGSLPAMRRSGLTHRGRPRPPSCRCEASVHARSRPWIVGEDREPLARRRGVCRARRPLDGGGVTPALRRSARVMRWRFRLILAGSRRRGGVAGEIEEYPLVRSDGGGQSDRIASPLLWVRVVPVSESGSKLVTQIDGQRVRELLSDLACPMHLRRETIPDSAHPALSGRNLGRGADAVCGSSDPLLVKTRECRHWDPLGCRDPRVLW